MSACLHGLAMGLFSASPVEGMTSGQFDETSTAKARIALNDISRRQAWVELDDMIMECKEYQEVSRATFDQVDISFLDGQITDLERVEAESLEGIAITDLESVEIESLDGIAKSFSNHPGSRTTARTSREVAFRE